jgi:hypothetical protein
MIDSWYEVKEVVRLGRMDEERDALIRGIIFQAGTGSNAGS